MLLTECQGTPSSKQARFLIFRLLKYDLNTQPHCNAIVNEHTTNFSIVTMLRVEVIFFELGVVKNFMQKFHSQNFAGLISVLQLIATVSHNNRMVSVKHDF